MEQIDLEKIHLDVQLMDIELNKRMGLINPKFRYMSKQSDPWGLILLIIFIREVFTEQSFNKKLTKSFIFNTSKKWSYFVNEEDVENLISESIKQVMTVDNRFQSMDSFYAKRPPGIMPIIISLVDEFIPSDSSHETIFGFVKTIGDLFNPSFLLNRPISLTLSHIIKLLHSTTAAQSILLSYPGSGQILTSIILEKRSSIKLIVCQDPSIYSLLFCSIKCHLLRFLNYELSSADLLDEGMAHRASDDKYDLIISTPPRYLNAQIEADQSNFHYGEVSKQSLPYGIIQSQLSVLSKYGKMIQHIPNYQLRQSELSKLGSVIRKNLLKADIVESVISLPTANFTSPKSSPIESSIVIFDTHKSIDTKGSVFFLNGSRSEDQSKYTEDQVSSFWEELFEIYLKKSDLYPFSKMMSNNSIIENTADTDLNVKRYADSSEQGKFIRSYMSGANDSHVFKLGDPSITLDYRVVAGSDINKDEHNSIYIPVRHSFMWSVVEISIENLEHRPYHQFILNKDVVLNSYIKSFYSSGLGHIILEHLSESTALWSRRHITKEALFSSEIVVPDILVQQTIVQNKQKINYLVTTINDFEQQMCLNFSDTTNVGYKLDEMIQSAEGISTEDRIKLLIRGLESKTVEFKQTFSLDIKRSANDKKYAPKKEASIENAVLKTIAAFINSEGGTLLIGVHDNGTITGIGDEITKFHSKSEDKFLLYLKDRLIEAIGKEFINNYDYNLIKIEKKTIIEFQCRQSKEDICFIENIFYVRTNPSTERLEGNQMMRYIKNHFHVQ